MQNRLPLLIAHRGESFDAPENTLASFALAWQRGDDAIELDIHLTADDQLIVCHDHDTLRTTGTKLVIKDQPLAALQALDAGRWKDAVYAGQRMPTLDEVIRQTPPCKRIFIEIKVGPEAVPALARVIAQHADRAADFAIISFNIDSVRTARNALPQCRFYWLVSPKCAASQQQWHPSAADMIQTVHDAKLNGMHVESTPIIDADFVHRIHQAKLELFVWTIDDADMVRKTMALGVDGITTNRAAWMRGQVGG